MLPGDAGADQEGILRQIVEFDVLLQRRHEHPDEREDGEEDKRRRAEYGEAILRQVETVNVMTGEILAFARGDTSLLFWDARTGKQVRRLALPASRRGFAFRSGPSVLLSGS